MLIWPRGTWPRYLNIPRKCSAQAAKPRFKGEGMRGSVAVTTREWENETAHRAPKSLIRHWMVSDRNRIAIPFLNSKQTGCISCLSIDPTTISEHLHKIFRFPTQLVRTYRSWNLKRLISNICFSIKRVLCEKFMLILSVFIIFSHMLRIVVKCARSQHNFRTAPILPPNSIPPWSPRSTLWHSGH